MEFRITTAIPFSRGRVEPPQVAQYVEESSSGGSAPVLCGLILSARCRHRGDRSKEAIARRSRVSPERVGRMIKGRFIEAPLGWILLDQVLAVLKALDATPAEIEAASRLYEQVVQEHKATLIRTRPADQPAPSATSAPAKPASPPGGPDGNAAPSAPDHKIKEDDQKPGPDPMEARDSAEFNKMMEAFRASKGNKSFRQMEKENLRLNDVLEEKGLPLIEFRSYGTYNNVHRSKKLPSLETMRSYIVAAGGDLAELARWEKARARLAADHILRWPSSSEQIAP